MEGHDKSAPKRTKSAHKHKQTTHIIIVKQQEHTAHIYMSTCVCHVRDGRR